MENGLLHKRVLQPHPLPISNEDSRDIFLPFEDARAAVEAGLALKEQLSSLPALNGRY